jgi:hypothetical protein
LVEQQHQFSGSSSNAADSIPAISCGVQHYNVHFLHVTDIVLMHLGVKSFAAGLHLVITPQQQQC